MCFGVHFGDHHANTDGRIAEEEEDEEVTTKKFSMTNLDD